MHTVGQVELQKAEKLMSVPMPLDVVVIGNRGDVAGIAAAILRGEEFGGYNPRISAAWVMVSTDKSAFFATGEGRKLNVDIATSYQLMDARRVDLWLALDATSAESARIYIMHNGPPPNNFYRGVFPDPVVPCGFEIPHMPSTKMAFADWLDLLTENLKPWRERIWNVYRDSS
jgi:hypothetical protein